MTAANSDSNQTNDDSGDDARQRQSSEETTTPTTTTTTTTTTESTDQKPQTTTTHDENDQTDCKKKDEDDDVKNAKKEKKIRNLVRFLLVVPYIVGIVWTCLHPIVSVITGELKCRGWYLDEHSIETRFTMGQSPQNVPLHLEDLHQLAPVKRDEDKNAPCSLCDFFARKGDPGFNPKNLICHRHGDHFEMAMILPLSNAIDAREEAVVLVVPRPGDVYRSLDETGGIRDWNSSIFHQAMVRSIRHLANPVETPWLAKTVLVVTPTISSNSNINSNSNSNSNNNNNDGESNPSLEQTVSSFLDAYSGEQTIPQDYDRNRREDNNKERSIPQLPPMLSGAILRNIVVLEVIDKSIARSPDKSRTPVSTDLSILPQGRRGVLPNADLVFLVGKLMDKTLLYAHADAKTFLTHPYTNESKTAVSWANRWILGSDFLNNHKERTKKAGVWARGLIDLFFFAKTLAVGPYPPHAPALERGIDSLTIRAVFEGTYRRDPSVELVQHSEYIVRSLANLHERLHHSFTLYLLPTPKAFVSHIEYLLPNILVVLPLAVRVFGMLLPKMNRGLDLKALGGILLIVLVVDVVFFLAADVFGCGDIPQTMTALYVVLCTGAAFFWVTKILLHRRRDDRLKNNNTTHDDDDDDDDDSSDPETTRTILTLQFATCTLAVYILVPIAFSHASLSYLPSVLWTPLLAFPDYSSMKNSNDSKSKNSIHKFLELVVVPIVSCLLVVATAPPVLLVPRVFSVYTPFVRYAYAPIHVLFVLLVTSIRVS